MSRAVVQHVKDLLLRKDLDSLVERCESDRQYWKALRFVLYEPDEDFLWPAVKAVALLMERWWASGEEERVREYIRTLLWSLNDESGGIGWNAPQTIAEIIVNIPSLLEPYASMMITRTLEEPPLVNSCLWAIGRLGERVHRVLEQFDDLALAVFRSTSPQTLGLAAWAMGEAAFAPADPHLQGLRNRPDTVRIYLDGRPVDKPIGEWATEALDRIHKDHTN